VGLNTRLNTGRDVAYSLKRKRTVDEIQSRDIPTPLNLNRHPYEGLFKGKAGSRTKIIRSTAHGIKSNI